MNTTDKKELRRRIERLRSALTPEERAGRERRINQRLTAWLKGVIAGRHLSPGAFAGAAPAPAKQPEDRSRLEEACAGDGYSGTGTPANPECTGSRAVSGAPDIPIVLAYVPFRTECGIHETVEACWEAGIRVYAPRSLHATRELLFHEIRRWEDLQEGMHGIMEPDPLSPALEDPLAASAVLVPGLAFDTACGRLGYGGGYYDRFLEKLLKTAREEGRAAPFFAAAAFDVQLVERLPAEPHDIGLDVLITESAAYTRNPAADRKRGEDRMEHPDKLTHFNEQGRARMVDISEKKETRRTAVARTSVTMLPETLLRVREGRLAKGDVLAVAQVAGIMAAKKTADWIPMCHPLALSGVDIRFVYESGTELGIEAEVRTTGPTGVEMEALTAVSAAALTVYDMCKALQKDMVIGPTMLVSKTGGKNGDFHRFDTHS